MADDIDGMRAELGMPTERGDDLRALFAVDEVEVPSGTFADVRTVAGTIEVSQQLLDQFKPLEGVPHSFDVYMADQLCRGYGVPPKFVWPEPQPRPIPKFSLRDRGRIAVCGFRARVALFIAPWLYEDPPDPWDD